MTTVTKPELLNSWKEIASYLGRGVRTVQRWETLGLPVRRPHGHSRSPVFAFTRDLDAWLTKTPHDRVPRTNLNFGGNELQRLIQNSIELRTKTRALREEHHRAIVKLFETLSSMPLHMKSISPLYGSSPSRFPESNHLRRAG